MEDGTLELSEEQRQIVILALAELALSRPGWDATIGEIVDVYNGRQMWAKLKSLNADRVAAERGPIDRSVLIAADDPHLQEWLCNASDETQGAGSFVRRIAEAGLRADHENYPLLRPVLLELREKYPNYLERRRPAG